MSELVSGEEGLVSGRHRWPARNETARSQTWQGSSVFTQVKVLTRRAVLEFLSDPRSVLLGMLQPVVILFLMTGMFGRSAHFPHGITFFDYVLPAVLVDNAVQTSLQSGVGLVEDLKNGIVARLRSLPILPSSMLIARCITSLIRCALQGLIMLTLAQITHGDVLRGGLAGPTVSLGLTLLLAWSLGWVFLAAGVWIRRAETLQNLGFMVLLPLMFASSAYLPVRELPSVLRVVAYVNPLTYAINATRTVFFHTPGGTGAILPAVLLSLVLAAAGAFGAVVGFRRPL